VTDQLHKRGKDFEAKFAHDQDLDFKAHARRNHLLANWALGKLTIEDSDGFVENVISIGLKGDEAVRELIKGEFDAQGVEQSDHQIEREMEALLATARDQIKNEV